GSGRVILGSGEPGIGKTSLVTRFLQDLEPDARVLFGACDNLTIPRPLGPFRDIAGSVSASLRDALFTGSDSHEIHSLLLEELGQPPEPTLLVLEDVHWADDATLDVLTVLGRRIRSLPAVLVLTYRGGEARALRAVVGALPAGASLSLELGPLSEGAVASLVSDDA